MPSAIPVNAAIWRVALPGRVFSLIAVALALAVLAAVALSLNLSRLTEGFTWVQHTNQVLREISAVERALLEAELSERGYLLADEASYLATYNRSRTEIPRLLVALRELIADNPVQTRRVDELRADIEARLDEFKQAIELGPERLTEALAILKTARSRQLTPRIEERLSELRQTEFSLLDRRQLDTNRSAVLSTFFAVALSIFALLSAAIGIFLLEHQRTMLEVRWRAQLFRRRRDRLCGSPGDGRVRRRLVGGMTDGEQLSLRVHAAWGGCSMTDVHSTAAIR